MSEKRQGDPLLYVLGAFKLVKAAVLIAIGAGALKLIGKDAGAIVEHWVETLGVDPQSGYVHTLLSKLSGADARELKGLSAATFIYAGMFLLEGIGLMMRKRWAEYLTIIITGSFVPFEVYELASHTSVLKLVAIVVNVAIVAYLVIRVRRERHASKIAADGQQ